MQILAHKPPFDAAGILGFAAAESPATATATATISGLAATSPLASILTLTGVDSRSEDLSDEDLARIATALFFRIFRFNPLENYMRLERKALLDRIEMLNHHFAQ